MSGVSDRKMFREIVGEEHCPPLVITGAIETWPATSWTIESLQDIIKDRKLQCKVAPIDHKYIQWETDSLHLEITLGQYQQWLDGTTDQDNPLKHIPSDQFSCYVDYKYMKDVFEESDDVLKTVDWSVFGLKGRDGGDSTIWIGSKGTYTPCHQDSYGFNLVAQTSGRKRWYLFDPQQTEYMYPTRVPYEESSVYSEVNVRFPDTNRHPNFMKITPYIVELVPGDVLYVPKQWWHFVESLEPSISINTWVPMESDGASRVEESMTRLLFSSLSSCLLSPTQQQQCLNTGEVVQSTSLNMHYINMAINALTETQSKEGTDWFTLFLEKHADMSVLFPTTSLQMKPNRKRKHSQDSVTVCPAKCITTNDPVKNLNNKGETSVKIEAVCRLEVAEFHEFLSDNFKWSCSKGVCSDLRKRDVSGEYESTNEFREGEVEQNELTCVCHCKTNPDDSVTVTSDKSSVKKGKKQSKTISTIDVLKAVLHPSVVTTICEVLLQKD